MQHALRVRRRQAGAQLTGDVDDLLRGQPSDAAEQRGEVFAANQLHRVEDPALGLADVEDAAHGRVRDLPRQPNFVEDALARLRDPSRSISFSATGVSSTRSSARQTSPMPPRPIRAIIR